MTQTIKIFKVSECDWCAAETIEGAREAQIQIYGHDTVYDARLEGGLFESEAEEEELTDQDLLETKFYEEYGEEDTAIPFRQKLDQMIAEGEKFPCHFASTEF